MNNNVATGTIVSNQSLVLQKVSRNRAGVYTCVGSNQEGDSDSNSVVLDVKCEYEKNLKNVMVLVENFGRPDFSGDYGKRAFKHFGMKTQIHVRRAQKRIC